MRTNPHINWGISYPLHYVDNNAGKHCTQQREVSHPSSLFLQPTNQRGECTGIVDTGGKFATGVNNASENGVKICRRCR